MKKYVAILGVLLVGCAAGATVQGLSAQSFPPNATAPRWEQYCETMETRMVHHGDAEAIGRLLARRGQEGWEAVFVVSDGVCFKRPIVQ